MATRESWVKRYAQAVFEIAQAQGPDQMEGALDAWSAELAQISQVLENTELRVFLQHVKVRLKQKMKAIGEVLPEVSPMARNLLALLVSRGLADRVPGVEAEFRRLVDQHRGVERVKVYSAVALEDGERERVTSFVKEAMGRQVVLEEEVDSSIIGGLIIRVGDKLLDGSTRTKLEDLKRGLESATVGSKT
jgi:F-type H+-transporting ATPase subunit delta